MPVCRLALQLDCMACVEGLGLTLQCYCPGAANVMAWTQSWDA